MKRLLSDIATQMMEETKPSSYAKSIREMQYLNGNKTISMVGLLCDDLGDGRETPVACGISREDRRKCLEAISSAMEFYVHDYPASFSVKLNLRCKFAHWLERLQTEYGFSCNDYESDFFTGDLEPDKGIALVKTLQERKGISKAELKRKFSLSNCSIQKDLRRLDPDLREDGDPEDAPTPFRIGGQPVRVKITRIKHPGDKQRFYRTTNSLHPIVLQENLMQVGTLIQALARNFDENESEISLQIGADIWYQLTEYARSRIRAVYAAGDQIVGSFVEQLDNDFPDGRFLGFQTERELISEPNDMSVEEFLTYCIKAPERRCDIKLVNGTMLVDQCLTLDSASGRYIAQDARGVLTKLSRYEIDSIDPI